MSDETDGLVLGVSPSETDGPVHRTPVPVPVARFDDPHMREATSHPRRTERIIAASFVLGGLSVAGFGAAYWVNGPPWTLAVTFGAGLLLLGFGLTAWGKYLMPQGPFVEERHPLASSPEEQDAMSAALVQRTGVVVKRRKMLGGLFAGGAGLFGIVALFPLLRSLGPLPGNTFEVTNWRRNSLLVDSNGRPVHIDTLQVGGIMTVFPKGWQDRDEGQAVDQTILIRVQTDDVTTKPGRESWSPRGYVAYSKLCTHLGCPVGLYEQQLQLLVCPCHQSMFSVLDAAIPTFGPAPRALPQLPLKVDSKGLLRAQAGYDQAVGPGFWERTTR
jgi:ubiquinol-cytochrome c reductase iron-sulfur subunit